MARRARLIVPGYPHHIVQRGHNRSVVFAGEEDYQYYLNNLEMFKQEYNVKVYGFCLMTNHIHLIVDPCDSLTAIPELMKRLAGRQTRYVNKLQRRSGSLWEGRYKVSPIDSDAYLLQCCRYVDLNPVKAKLVVRPEDYEWSSYRAATGISYSEWLDDSQVYLALGSTQSRRGERYRDFVNEGVSSEQQQLIQRAVERNQLTGNTQFIDEIERKTGVRVDCRGQGRPK
jgi:REP-associated tyrosine transposase